MCIPNCAGRICGDNGCGGSCGTCVSNANCQGGICYCDQGYVPSRDSMSCSRLGGSCPLGVTQDGYCSGDYWVRCDPRHGLAVLDCGVGNCGQFTISGTTFGSCGCNDQSFLHGCAVGVTGIRNDLQMFCLSGAVIARNCATMTGRSTGFCSAFVSGVGYAVNCFCDQCSFLNSSGGCNNMCASSFDTCNYDSSKNIHSCS
jgi:hypothetical protein